MKSTTCRKCGKFFPDNLKKCPHCNATNRKVCKTIITATLLSIWVCALITILLSIIFIDKIAFLNSDSSEVLQTEPQKETVETNDFGISAKSKFGGKIELTIPKEFLELGDKEFDYQLTKEQKDQGFLDIKKNKDGSATYTIKKSDYKVFIEELKQTTSDSLNSIVSDAEYSSIQKIEFTDRFETVTLIVKRTQFENSFDSLSIFSCGLTSCVYQMFDVDSPKKCLVQVKDSKTGEIFKTATYPDELSKN